MTKLTTKEKLNLFDKFGKDALCNIEAFEIREIIKNCAQNHSKILIDMSRGDPCYPPDIFVNKVFVFLLTVINCIQEETGSSSSVIWSLDFVKIQNALRRAEAMYQDDQGHVVKMAYKMINRLEKITGKAGNKLWIDLIRGMQSTGYGDVSGEDEVKAVLADYLFRNFALEVNKENIILTLGATEAIGKLFDLLSQPSKLGFLSPKHPIGTISPVFGPYNALISKDYLSLNPICLKTYPRANYEPDDNGFKEFEGKVNSTPPRLFILVNPSNPTGRIYKPETLERLATILKGIHLGGKKEEGIPIIEDIVYADFAPERFCSISKYAKPYTIIIGSMSHFFRATGNRFGYIVITDETNDFLTKFFELDIKKSRSFKHLFKHNRKLTFLDLFKIAKSTDPVGASSHTLHIPKIAQYLGMLKLMLDEGGVYRQEMIKKWQTFYNGREFRPFHISEQENFVPYYCLVDFEKLIEVRKSEFTNLYKAMRSDKITPENLVSLLSYNGLVSLPAATFYPGEELEHHWVIRFSIANVEMLHISTAIGIINNSLTELDNFL